MTTVGEEEANFRVGLSNFKFHEFTDEIGDFKLNCHIIRMEDSLYLWVGNFTEQVMNDLSFALQVTSASQEDLIATKIIGDIVDTTSLNVAKRLTKKVGKPVYVSFNIPTGNLLLLKIEKRIHEELKACSDLLSF